MTPPEVDLAKLVERLDASVPSSARAGFVMGKTAFRDAVVVELGCSVAEAERLVDTLVSRGLLRLEKDPSGASPDRWVLGRA